MTPSDTQFTSRLLLGIIFASSLSCDVFDDTDRVKPEKQVVLLKSNFHILPGTSVVIDFKSVIDQSFSDVTLMIFEDPRRGALTQVNSLLYKYTPGLEFQDGLDYFVVAAVNKGKILAKSTLTIFLSKNKESFPCELFAIEDKIKFKKTDSSPVVIQVLENDRLCEIDKSDLSISIHTQPKFGQAVVNDESIVYTPGPEYKDYDELIYQVTRATDGSIFYGLFSLSDRPEFTIQKIAGYPTSLFFIDENKGFLGTTTGLYRTTDGGTHWNPSLLNSYCHDIFFLNETKGFAVMDGGQIITTTNGGITWELLTNLDKTAFGIVFTSETTGFIAVNDYSGDWGLELSGSILKTEDGGLTWREVFMSFEAFEGLVDIQFANSNIGYALSYERLFVTTDAGETWNLLLDKTLKHLDATAENKVFAVLVDDESEIITNEIGYQWRPVADLSFGILSLKFLPAADVGFASTLTSEAYHNDNPRQPLSILKTVDHGKTWVKQNFGEHLYGSPLGMSVPSKEVAYFLCTDRVIKYSYK